MRFTKAVVQGQRIVEVEVREIDADVIRACPHLIFDADHYRDNGSCRCDDPSYDLSEYGYSFVDGRWT